MNIFKTIADRLYKRLVLFNNPFYFYGIAKADYSARGQSIKLPGLGVETDLQNGRSIIQGYPYAKKIHDALGGKFSFNDQKIILHLQDLKFQINSAEELFIISEVFISEVYKFCCLRETIFIDIGMNSGITTLFYARDPMVKKVYSYELFKPTYELGNQNLKLNQAYSQKVHAYNYGLSDKDFKTTLDFSLSRKGRMGLKGLPDDEQFSDVRKEAVEVRDIKTVFEDIISASQQFDIVAKMDCEGEEFTLVRRLAETGLLGKIAVLIIEWHYTPPKEIEDHLKTFSFYVFTQTLPTLDSGMIYAARR